MHQTNSSKKPLLLTVVLLVAAVIIFYVVVAMPWNKIGSVDNLETVDLTTMNSTMVYAYVNDMVNTRPNDYLGKTIKAKGKYYKSYSNSAQKYFHYVIISDATACCAQGIEFLYDGDYPSEDAEIIISGTFDRYKQQGRTLYFIATTQLSIA